ncbi:RCE1 [Candida theae]|uniref:intramembrane prenyl-peptidase Rce1 n=1 Tax=Candida theae TaxID=1198502 RepID=A0AAD5FYP8_9ASCO|nr:RCE1 [Candida theae]KAI5958597.1 RCE1 [Candida theae]
MIYESLTLAIASSYVAAIYFALPTHLRNKDRNNFKVIRHRLKRVTLLCAVLVLFIPLLIPGSFINNIRQVGLVPGLTTSGSISNDIASIWYSFKFINILFACSILQIYVESTLNDISNTPILYHVRDYVFAPMTEELIYRGLVLLVVTKTCPHFVKYTPYLFGIAHFHHAIESYNSRSIEETVQSVSGSRYCRGDQYQTRTLRIQLAGVSGAKLIEDTAVVTRAFLTISSRTRAAHLIIYHKEIQSFVIRIS